MQRKLTVIVSADVVSYPALMERDEHYDLVCTYLQWREFDTALDLLERVLEKMAIEGVNWMKADADVDPVRDHPRFKAIVARAEARLA